MKDLTERVYRYALRIIQFIESLNKRDPVVQVIIRQLLRSATSVSANVIEAQAGSSKKDFANFYTHALKSGNESKLWLCLLRDSKKAPADQACTLLRETNELANILGASVATIKGKRKSAKGKRKL